MKFSADSLDFFAEDGQVGIAASNRIKGVVLHDILSRMKTAEDLKSAVRVSVLSGDITLAEADEIENMLAERIAQVEDRGWFPESGARILNETSLIDSNGLSCRPDRVVIKDDKVMIIDYKFGEHDSGYEDQLRKYYDIWSKMGYENISAWIWYVHTGEIVSVC
jgi:hypothetical protein